MKIPRYLERFADPALVDHGLGRSHTLGETHLLVHCHHALPLARMFDQPHGLLIVIGNGFLAQQVLARIQHRHGHLKLRPGEYRDVDHGHIRVGGQFRVRGIHLGNAVALGHVFGAI